MEIQLAPEAAPEDGSVDGDASEQRGALLPPSGGGWAVADGWN